VPEKYSWIIQVAVETINPEIVGTDWLDQWLHHVGPSLSNGESGYRSTGYRYDATTQPFIELSAVRGTQSVDTRLLVAPLADGLAVFLGGCDADPEQEACDAWIAASHEATTSLGSSGSTFEWTALLGPPTPGTMAAVPHLGESIRIGPALLNPQPEHVFELGASPTNPSLSTCTSAHWWPILAEGSHVGYSWNAASKKVAFDLHRVCSLLSVALDVCAVVREAPAPRQWGIRKAPPRLSWQKENDFLSAQAAHAASAPVQVFPVDLVSSWDEMTSRPWLAHAIGAYHEGLLTDSTHPSLALIAYVAAIESVANRLFTQSRCPTCNAQEQVAGRFRAALKLVLDESEAERLGGAYNPRSLTVHQGRLHGFETVPGSAGFGFHNPEHGFFVTVRQMRRAARELLLLALRRQLPSKEDFSPAAATLDE
jgi:hypothetical protein